MCGQSARTMRADSGSMTQTVQLMFMLLAGQKSVFALCPSADNAMSAHRVPVGRGHRVAGYTANGVAAPQVAAAARLGQRDARVGHPRALAQFVDHVSATHQQGVRNDQGVRAVTIGRRGQSHNKRCATVRRRHCCGGRPCRSGPRAPRRTPSRLLQMTKGSEPQQLAEGVRAGRRGKSHNKRCATVRRRHCCGGRPCRSGPRARRRTPPRLLRL